MLLLLLLLLAPAGSVWGEAVGGARRSGSATSAAAALRRAIGGAHRQQQQQQQRCGQGEHEVLHRARSRGSLLIPASQTSRLASEALPGGGASLLGRSPAFAVVGIASWARAVRMEDERIALRVMNDMSGVNE